MNCGCCGEQKNSLDNICLGSEKLVVSIETVKAMADFPLWEIEPDDQFYFNDEPNSENVYFSTKTGMQIDESDIREKVFAKHSDEDDTYVCYCFKVKVGDLRTASTEEREAIFAKIKASSAKGQCSCKTRNPKGSCCVGDVKKMIDKFNNQ